MSDDDRPLTYGEEAVGLVFNPSGDPKVTSIKQLFADAIDEINELRDKTSNSEVKRMFELAISEAQVAQMWAVKAITWKHDQRS